MPCGLGHHLSAPARCFQKWKHMDSPLLSDDNRLFAAPLAIFFPVIYIFIGTNFHVISFFLFESRIGFLVTEELNFFFTTPFLKFEFVEYQSS